MRGDKYEREDDNIEAILADARETHGRLGVLIESLSKATAVLRAETGNRSHEEGTE